MIYKNYISDKNLSRLDIFISIFLLACFYYHCWTLFSSSSYCLGFFCKLWRLVNANCNFCVFIFCIIFTLIWLVLIRNVTYLLACLLACLLTYLQKNFLDLV